MEIGDNCEKGLALVYNPLQIAVKFPAGYLEVLAVVDTDIGDTVTNFSLSGPEVDVAAPGGSKATGIRILSTTKGGCVGGCYRWGSGTSQAAPHVTGAVALAFQFQSGFSLAQVRSLRQTTAVPTLDRVGLVNDYNMVQELP